MKKCFVIQPFDDDKFDKRFEDTFAPAIKAAHLEPYRIDKDLGVRIPIEDIEKGIMESVICFAEITTNNPNVWYELGFAFACGKDVVMVCSDEREGKFPFDIQHKQIITYKTGSKSDFDRVEDTITKKIFALLQKSQTVNALNVMPVVDTEGLKSHEIALLILTIENSFSHEDSLPIYNLQSKMNKSGYTDIATSVGIRTLTKYGMIETFKDQDWNGNEFTSCKLTQKGEDWILSNQDRLQYEIKENLIQDSNDGLPF